MLTEAEIAQILSNAAWAAKRLPPVRLPRCENVWNSLLAMAPVDDSYPEDKPVYEPFPQSLLDDLDCATGWLVHLPVRERRIMWMRADGHQWAHIARMSGVTPRWCQRLWHQAAEQIAAQDQTGPHA